MEFHGASGIDNGMIRCKTQGTRVVDPLWKFQSIHFWTQAICTHRDQYMAPELSSCLAAESKQGWYTMTNTPQPHGKFNREWHAKPIIDFLGVPIFKQSHITDHPGGLQTFDIL